MERYGTSDESCLTLYKADHLHSSFACISAYCNYVELILGRSHSCVGTLELKGRVRGMSNVGPARLCIEQDLLSSFLARVFAKKCHEA